MLDKSIPYYGVLMVKSNPAEYPDYTLPDGYTLCPYRQGMEEDWAALQLMTEQFDSPEDARGYFAQEFLAFPDELPGKCLFVKDRAGSVIATASIWRGEHFGQTLQRIHWVAVHPGHQGKGLAKALITQTLNRFNELGYTDFVYLTTQTWSYKAIGLYLQFGFEPYLGSRPIHWRCTDEQFDREKETAWELIRSKIKPTP